MINSSVILCHHFVFALTFILVHILICTVYGTVYLFSLQAILVFCCKITLNASLDFIIRSLVFHCIKQGCCKTPEGHCPAEFSFN